MGIERGGSSEVPEEAESEDAEEDGAMSKAHRRLRNKRD
jgi:hypothetical protein